MSNHTPGPWVLSRQSPKIIMQGFEFVHAEGPIIGSVTGNDNSGFYVSEAEATANAQLIAAAPELLEALERAEESLCLAESLFDMHQDDSPNFEPAILSVRAAIAKARGETA